MDERGGAVVEEVGVVDDEGPPALAFDPLSDRLARPPQQAEHVAAGAVELWQEGRERPEGDGSGGPRRHDVLGRIAAAGNGVRDLGSRRNWPTPADPAMTKAAGPGAASRLTTRSSSRSLPTSGIFCIAGSTHTTAPSFTRRALTGGFHRHHTAPQPAPGASLPICVAIADAVVESAAHNLSRALTKAEPVKVNRLLTALPVVAATGSALLSGMPGAAAGPERRGHDGHEATTAEVVGLYLDPPEKALVLGLERSGGPRARRCPEAGRLATVAGDPRWPGGRSGGGCGTDVLAFLELVEKQVPADLEVLAILTSGSAGAGQLLARWLEGSAPGQVALAAHPRRLILAEPRRAVAEGALPGRLTGPASAPGWPFPLRPWLAVPVRRSVQDGCLQTATTSRFSPRWVTSWNRSSSTTP